MAPAPPRAPSGPRGRRTLPFSAAAAEAGGLSQCAAAVAALTIGERHCIALTCYLWHACCAPGVRSTRRASAHHRVVAEGLVARARRGTSSVPTDDDFPSVKIPILPALRPITAVAWEGTAWTNEREASGVKSPATRLHPLPICRWHFLLAPRLQRVRRARRARCGGDGSTPPPGRSVARAPPRPPLLPSRSKWRHTRPCRAAVWQRWRGRPTAVASIVRRPARRLGARRWTTPA
eukprot:scaffold44999_cov59-Phaeocystis_antarctica.AAC.4